MFGRTKTTGVASHRTSSFTRQTNALTSKSFRIAFIRHWVFTFIRAFVAPVAFIIFLAYAKNLFIPPSIYGYGDPAAIQDLASAVAVDKKLVFVNNGLGSEVDNLIDRIASPVRQAGKQVVVLDEEVGLLTTCKSNLNGVSHCYGAVVFKGLPSAANNNTWNYTLRADAALSTQGIKVGRHDNGAQKYLLPLQLATDNAITNSTVIPNEFMYTSLSEKQRQDRLRVRFMGGIIDVLGVAFFLGIVGVSYQLVGMMATEREVGLSQLLNSMGTRQYARLMSYHIAFSAIYAPGWIIMGLVLSFGVFQKTSIAIVLIFHILAGLSLSSMSLFGGAFFKKAQLSGISVTLISIFLAVIAQATCKTSTGAIAILALIFPPMNYVYFIIYLARWERQNEPASLVHAAPQNPWTLPGIVLWVFCIIHIFLFPILAALVETWIYGTASKARTIGTTSNENAVELVGFSKTYTPSWWQRKFSKTGRETVKAVQNFDAQVRTGSITCLLGANGSGKSTTIDAISGLSKISDGEIRLDSSASGQFGVCPQKNVLWDDLTVEEHVKYWAKLKSKGVTKDEIQKLIRDCDLWQKRSALSKTLSGGQKRKLQIASMLIGGTKICAIDEVSSGLDPLSRRKIWDILLAERGKRTMILTTHYLDEADLLSDHIFILSKGKLQCEGSSAELKDKFGGGYRVHCPTIAPDVPGIMARRLKDETVYLTDSSATAGQVTGVLERAGIQDYHVNGPSIETVFLKVCSDVEDTDEGTFSDSQVDYSKEGAGLELYHGREVGMLASVWILFRKRCVIFRRNYIPNIAAVIIPIVAAGITMRFLNGFNAGGCGVADSISYSDLESFSFNLDVEIAAGPQSIVTASNIQKFQTLFSDSTAGASSLIQVNVSSLSQAIHITPTYDDFRSYIQTNYQNVTPGGIYSPQNQTPTIGFEGNGAIVYAIYTLNLLNNLRNNAVTIATTYSSFDVVFGSGTGDTLQFITYFGLAMSVYPAFFALYPTIERIRKVRALHYSNGVRALPLWFAYVAFDFLFVLIISVIVTIIFAVSSSVWYHLGYLFVVMALYGLTSILLVSVMSLVAKSQLAAFAMTAGYQAVWFLLYFIAYMCVLTYAPVEKQTMEINIVHYTLSIISPVASLQRGLFASLNLFQILCKNDTKIGYPGNISAYGGPILYLVVQSMILFGFLVWWDSGAYRLNLLAKRNVKTGDEEEEGENIEKDVLEELHRVGSSNDGLKVMHLSKTFGKNRVVQNISFGVQKGEIFSLLGPNGAGKSTTISMIRGDLPPDRGGDITVEGFSVRKNRPQARSYLGTCPQYDAIDALNVREHLVFYARIRGVSDVKHNVDAVLNAVGLVDFANRMAIKLSGGNKRKLSLGIALMGNPSAILLDEPSSGMDARAKRIMWKTLKDISPNRSVVLTTHSMEESENLSKRVGIISKKMLALGSTTYLRNQFGNNYHIHIVLASAPNTTDEEMERVKGWLLGMFEGAELEDKSLHGQIKFKVPANGRTVNTVGVMAAPGKKLADDDTISSASNASSDERVATTTTTTTVRKTSISSLFEKFETHKKELGILYYSVSQTSLEEVFLNIVGKSEAIEEGYEREHGDGVANDGMVKKRWWKRS